MQNKFRNTCFVLICSIELKKSALITHFSYLLYNRNSKLEEEDDSSHTFTSTKYFSSKGKNTTKFRQNEEYSFLVTQSYDLTAPVIWINWTS